MKGVNDYKMKRIISIAAAVIMLLSLASCGSKEINTEELAKELVDNLTFAEELNKVDGEITLKRYGIDSDAVQECVSYAGTAAVADEVTVIKANDVSAVSDKLNEHWDSQIKSYTSYRPEEVPKLENAVLYQYNDTVIFVVSEDHDDAQKLIISYTTK